MLRFPIWMLHPLDEARASEVSNTKGYRFTFTSAERATEFMIALKDSAHFSLRLVSRSDAPRVAAELRQAGARGICLNALVSGKAGWNIDTDVFALAIPERAPVSEALDHS